MNQLDTLRASSFGKRTAEEEREHLIQYFVETEQWRRVYSGDIDIIYGPKGSGKSAIYSLILANEDKLFDKNIIAIAGENPQGAPAFTAVGDLPTDEFEFISLWKLYIITLVGNAMRDFDINNEDAKKVIIALEEADLLPSKLSLGKALRYVFDYVRRLTSAEAIEGGLKIDPNTLMPTGVTGKISLREPGVAQAKKGIVSLDALFELASSALKTSGTTIWVLLDRLDVAFANKPNLEKIALRSLFKYYLDVKGHSQIRTKIFLRSDIWDDITKEGFREASHLENTLKIVWRQEDILNLVVRRALSNDAICKYYSEDRERVLADFDNQERFLYRMLPKQVETGINKPTALNWIISRTKDTVQAIAPREIIHFLNELRSQQITRLERGEKVPPDNTLFEQASFKLALPTVSQVRLEQTLYAEFPDMKPYIALLKDQKATQNTSNLALLWQIPSDKVANIAEKLEIIGFFERFGASQDVSWRVPFIYRSALSLIQGAAES